MTINLKGPELRELKPRIMVCGVGGAGGNAVNNMIDSGLAGVDFIVANTDAQALAKSKAERIIQLGLQVTEGLGAGSQPEVGRAATEEAVEEIRDHMMGAHMVFVTAGMGGGTGTGAAPVIARIARDMGILTVGVVTKPFQFEGQRRMRTAEAGIVELQKAVDTLIVIPNQNLFRVANEKTTFADAFAMADQVLYSGVACITDLMVKDGLINLDFADVRATMREMGKAMMGTGEASGERRAILAAEAAIANPLLDEVSMRGARGLLISITGGNDLTLYEVDEAASRIRQEVDDDANIILGATFDESLHGIVRVSVVATGIDVVTGTQELNSTETRLAEVAQRLRAQTAARQPEPVAPRQAEPVAQPISYVQPVAPAPLPVAVPAEPALQPEPGPAYAVLAEPVQLAAPPAVVAVHEVQLRAVAPRPQVFAEPPQPVAAPRPAERQPGPFVPPQAEQPVLRPQRLPQISDLPLPAQNQIRAQRGEQAPEHPVEHKRRTLMERLATFGIGRSEDTAPVPAPARPAVLQPRPQAQAPRPVLQAPVQQPPLQQGHAQPGPAAVHAEYGKRPQAAPIARQAPVPLDQHGRITQPQRQIDDDQLEIPAFLRRQSS